MAKMDDNGTRYAPPKGCLFGIPGLRGYLFGVGLTLSMTSK